MGAKRRLGEAKCLGLLLVSAAAALATTTPVRADASFTVDPGASWLGYMNVFDKPEDGGAFKFGSPWGTADLCATFSGPTLTLSPNTIGDPNSYWYTPSGGPGAVGNKIMDANMYIETPTGSLAGQNVTFAGNVLSNTLTDAHTSFAFIKDFAADYSSFNISTVSLAAGTFSISLATVNDGSRHVQYGFETIGQNVWFTDVGTFGSVQITATGGPAPQWALSGGGDWLTGANWTNSTAPDAVDASANFLGNITGAATVTLNASATVGTLKFANTNTYNIAGTGSLTIDVSSGNGSVVASSGSHEISVPLLFNDNTTVDTANSAVLTLKGGLSAGGVTLTKNGSGTLKIQGPVSNMSATTFAFTGGFTEVSTNLGLNTSVQAGGIRTDFNATQTLASLSVSSLVHIGPASSVTVSTQALSFTGGHIELLGGRMVVDYTGASKLGEVQTAISNGSLSHTAIGDGFVLASGEASDLFTGATGSFGGLTIDDSSVVVAYTVIGDANLDGTVNSTDFDKLVSTFGTLSGARWTQADFTGEGKVTTLDFNVLAGNFGAQAGSVLGSVVPEPASASLIVAAAAFGQRRRRDRDASR